MLEIGINQVSKSYGAQPVFNGIRFDILTGDRIGLIGANGCGKTTLLRMIQGAETCDAGEIIRRKGARIRCLEQMASFPEEMTVESICSGAFADVADVRRQLREMEHAMTRQSDGELERTMRRYSRCIEQFESMQGYETETKIDKVLQGLGIPEPLRCQPYATLSGGERTRVALARLLLEEPDVLLLDEPTNHLDIDSMEWLETFISDYRGTILLVSHDRHVLDHTVTRIVELHSDHAELYPCGYRAYLVEKDARFNQAMHAYLNQNKKIERMEQQIERYRIWGAMRSSEKMEKTAKVIQHRLDRIDRLDRPMADRKKPGFSGQNGLRSGKEVLSVQEIGHAFGSIPVLDLVEFDLLRRDRVCVLGPNGSGKTTLLKIILGEIPPDTGHIRLGAAVRIGYLPQMVEFPDENQTVLDYFSRNHSLTTIQARPVLARALFSRDEVFKRIRNLSGGERSRLRLCSLFQEQVNLLILDEPTNHLDIESREVLEAMLKEYAGTLLFVSHDRYFIEKTADRILALDDRRIHVFDMDYTSYRNRVRHARP